MPTFGRVSYREVWPGISTAFYGNQGRLEYDFDLAAGADPGRIALSFSGEQSLRTDRSGVLLIALPGGSVRQLAPYAYQQIGRTRQAVSARYVVSGRTVRLKLGAYDHGRPLVIDPVLAYSTYLGGSISDKGLGIAIDSSGAAYVTGFTDSADFPTTAGAYRTTRKGVDAFVAKLAASGASLAYSTYLGGSGPDGGYAIAVDSSGAAYVTGDTSSNDFPTTADAYQTTKNGGDDAFVAKLSPSGASLAYSTYLGGANYDHGNGIAIDASGAAYVTGFAEAGFPTSAGAYQATNRGGEDAFVAKLAPSGGTLAYSTYLGGSGYDYGSGIAVDSSGAAYVIGDTNSTDSPTTPGAYQTTNKGAGDAFVAKLSPSGASLAYSTYLGGGSGGDFGYGIAVDSSGAAYTTGLTNSTDFPTTAGAYQTTNRGGDDAFVAKLAPSGGSLAYSTYLGSAGSDGGYGIAVDSSGDAYVTGLAGTADFPTTSSAYPIASHGDGAFVAKLAPSGGALAYSNVLDGSNYEQGYGIAIDASGAAYATGETNSSEFPTTPGSYQTTNKGAGDAFVAKFTGLPTVTTDRAANVTQTSATLDGTVNPNGDATSYDFELGFSTAYGSKVPTQNAGADTTNHAESASIARLAPGTTYHFRIVATNSSGQSVGSDQTFTTAAAAARPPHKPKLKLSVSPHRATAGRRTCFAFTATARGHGVKGARIRFANTTARTSRSGKARICVKLNAGIHRATVIKSGDRAGAATVRVTRRARSKPRFTG